MRLLVFPPTRSRPPSAKTVSETSELSRPARSHCISTVGKITLPSTILKFWDLGGQRGIRSIWHRYYDDCHAVVFVIDADDRERLSEGWEVFGTYRAYRDLQRSDKLDRLCSLCTANSGCAAFAACQQARQPSEPLSRRNPQRLRRLASAEVRKCSKKLRRGDGNPTPLRAHCKLRRHGHIRIRGVSFDLRGVCYLTEGMPGPEFELQWTGCL